MERITIISRIIDELNMNRKKNIYKLSHKWYISVRSIIILFILSWLYVVCVYGCRFFFFSSLVCDVRNHRRCLESMFHTDSIVRDSYCIFMDCLLHLLYTVLPSIRCVGCITLWTRRVWVFDIGCLSLLSRCLRRHFAETWSQVIYLWLKLKLSSNPSRR